VALRAWWFVVGRGSLVVGIVRPAVVAIDGLSDWGSALHHVDSLRGHGLSTVWRPHHRLRGHRLRAASHCGIGAEDVRKGGVPGSRGLPILLRARVVSPLLIAVVCHVGVPAQELLLRRAWDIRGHERRSTKTFRMKSAASHERTAEEAQRHKRVLYQVCVNMS
jgi:hypothetical protein